MEHLKNQLSHAQKEADRLRLILGFLPDHIMLLDADGIILDINHTVADLTVEGVLGTPVFNYMNEDFSALAADCLKTVWETGQPSSYATTRRVRFWPLKAS